MENLNSYFSKLYLSNRIAIILLFVFTLILRLLCLNYYPLNIDEPFTVFYSQMSLSEIGEMLKTENNPPLFFILIHYWIHFFGISEFSVRFLSALFSAVTVVFIYLIGVDFFSKSIALSTSFLFIFSESHFEFAHDCRAYTLLVLLSVASIYYTLKLLLEKENRKHWILFTLSDTLLVYTHFIGWIIILIQLITVCFYCKDNLKRMKKFAISFSITLITLLPYLKIFIERLLFTTSNGTWVKPPHIVDLYNILWDYCNVPVVTVVFIFIFVCGVVLLLAKKSVTNTQFKVLLIWFLLPYIGLFLLSYKLPLYIERYLLIISIPFYFLLFCFVDLLQKKNINFRFLYILLPLAMLLTTNLKPSRKRSNKQIVELLSKIKTNSDAIIINPDWYDLTFAYYYNKEFFKDYKNLRINLNSKDIFPITDFSAIKNIDMKNYKRIIYFESTRGFSDPENFILKQLKENFKFIGCFKAYNFDVSVFTNRSESYPTTH